MGVGVGAVCFQAPSTPEKKEEREQLNNSVESHIGSDQSTESLVQCVQVQYMRTQTNPIPPTIL